MLKIMTIPLNGNKYVIWAKSISLCLYNKSKLGYVLEKIERPESHSYKEWETNDRIVMSWLLNSMEPAIAMSFLFLDSMKEIWDSLVDIYGEG